MDIKIPLKNETLIVALGTALCYTGAYAYERGFCLFFGIPTELITVTPGSIITTVCLFATFLMALYMASSLPVLIASKKNLKNKHIISILTLSPVWVIFNLIFFLTSGFKLLTFSIITVAYLFLSIGVTMSATESLNQNKTNDEHNTPSIFSKIDNAFAFIFWFSFLFFAITNGMGTFVARTTDNFHEFTFKNEKYKLLKSYGDNIIALKSKDTNKSKGVYIFKSEDLIETRLNQVKSKNAVTEE
ncbi:TPA: hypothetical protein QCJ76_001713 [Enterobacter asburiae]|nr:hypothetical protein [Enterobacter asburiae]